MVQKNDLKLASGAGDVSEGMMLPSQQCFQSHNFEEIVLQLTTISALHEDWT